MFWLYLTLGAQFFNSLAALLDKVLVSKRFPFAGVLTFWTAVANLFGVFFVFFDFNFQADSFLILISLLSGVSFSIALQFFYTAMKTGEATHIAPLSGGVLPIFSIVFSYFILSERLSSYEWVAVIFLILGALVISFEKSREHNGWHIGMLWAIIAGMFFSLSYVLGRYSFLQDTFSTGFVWARIGSFLAVLPLLFVKNIRQNLFSKAKSNSEKNKSFVLLVINKTSSAVYFVGINYAISLSSATIVNALSGLQYGILFVMVLLSTKFFPRYFKEKFSFSEIILQIIAIILISIGLVLLV
ncbi:MAG: EamA family transporter [Patescibacteria group bacterium]